MPAQPAECQTLARLHGAEGQAEFMGEHGLRFVEKIALLDELALLARQRRQGAAQVPLELGQIETPLRVVVRRHADRIHVSLQLAGAAADEVDETIAGNRVDPGRNGGARRVIQLGPLPEHQHHFLGHILSERLFGTEAAQVRLDTWRKAIEKLGEGEVILALGDRR